MLDAVIGLGGNVGEPLGAFRRAIAALEAGGDRVVARSSAWVTRPVGGPPQAWFHNAAIRVRTPRDPHALLAALQSIERAEGRERAVRWGPRTLDLDVLWIAGVVLAAPDLEVPHPRLAERWFALAPLVEVAPDARAPDGSLWRDRLATLDAAGATPAPW